MPIALNGPRSYDPQVDAPAVNIPPLPPGFSGDLLQAIHDINKAREKRAGDQAAGVSADFELKDAEARFPHPPQPGEQGPIDPITTTVAAIKDAAGKIKDPRGRQAFVEGQIASVRQRVGKMAVEQAVDRLGDSIATLAQSPENEAIADALNQLSKGLDGFDENTPPEFMVKAVEHAERSRDQLLRQNAKDGARRHQIRMAFGEGGYAEQELGTLPPGSPNYNALRDVIFQGRSDLLPPGQEFAAIQAAKNGNVLKQTGPKDWVQVPAGESATFDQYLAWKKSGQLQDQQKAEDQTIRREGQAIQGARLEETKADREQRGFNAEADRGLRAQQLGETQRHNLAQESKPTAGTSPELRRANLINARIKAMSADLGAFPKPGDMERIQREAEEWADKQLGRTEKANGQSAPDGRTSAIAELKAALAKGAKKSEAEAIAAKYGIDLKSIKPDELK